MKPLPDRTSPLYPPWLYPDNHIYIFLTSIPWSPITAQISTGFKITLLPPNKKVHLSLYLSYDHFLILHLLLCKFLMGLPSLTIILTSTLTNLWNLGINFTAEFLHTLTTSNQSIHDDFWNGETIFYRLAFKFFHLLVNTVFYQRGN